MAEINNYMWTNLPEHILVQIFSYLDFGQRCRTAQVCKTWLDCFNQPLLWKHFTFMFIKEKDQQYLNLARNHGHHMKIVKIILDQHEKINRENACEVLNILADKEKQKVSSLFLAFRGENPLFYAGLEFVQTLTKFFTSTTTQCLTSVDLGGLWIDLSEELLNVLADNQKNLQKLNIQNRSLICKISPTCILRLIEKCPKLTHLSLFYCSLSDDVLDMFCHDDRSPLIYLSIKCRRQEKYVKILSDENWTKLLQKSPSFKVTMIFDHNCPFSKFSFLLSPAIPISELRLETFTMLFDEINMAASYYKNTLKRLVLQTRGSKELEESLINLATKCVKLESLVVYCVLSKNTVETILTLCPRLLETKNYILKSKMDPEPWIVGVEEGD